MIWQYRKDVFEAKYATGCSRTSGSTRCPTDGSTWEQYYETAKWFTKNTPDGVPYGSGHQAKQHDSLMNDFSNVLWAYGGDYFDDGANVGRLGSNDPGEPRARLRRGDRRRRHLPQARSRSRTPASLSWDWDGPGRRVPAPASARWRSNWHEFAGRQRGIARSRARSATRALPKGPKRQRVHVRRHRGRHQRHVVRADEQKAAWLFVNWATSKETQLANLKSKVGGGTPTRDSVYELPEVKAAKNPPSKMPNILTTDAVFEAWKPENIGLRPKIAAWNECDTVIFTQLSKMLAGQQGPDQCMQQHQGRLRRQAIDSAAALRGQS